MGNVPEDRKHHQILPAENKNCKIIVKRPEIRLASALIDIIAPVATANYILRRDND